MKCKDCECCHLTTYNRWNPQIYDFQDVSVYECWGVKETFEIKDINRECTEYPERRAKKVKKSETFENKTSYVMIGTEECGLEITPDDIVFTQKGKKITMSEIMKMAHTNRICPCCGRELKDGDKNA